MLVEGMRDVLERILCKEGDEGAEINEAPVVDEIVDELVCL